MSHEFRTPIHAILGMVGMARRRSDDPKVRDCLVKAEDAANQLLSTLTGLLDLAMAESQRLTLDRVQFRASDVISGAVRQSAEALKSKAITLELAGSNLDSTDTEWIIGDPVRIQQIIHELICNSIKFSEAGTIKIVSGVESDDSGQLWFFCKVSDEGIGIAPERHREIFLPFHQVDGSMTRSFGGSGIGLALCRQLVGHMGGTISVDSTLGHGATFTFRLPVEKAVTPEAEIDPDQDLSAQVRMRHGGARILVAEDDQVVQSLIKSVLEQAGLKVSVARDGAAAVEMARSTQFKLILMDLIMPSLSGIEAAQAIRALENYKTVPILATTARAFEEDRRECLRAGINAHITKPFAPNMLLITVMEWLCRDQSH